MQKRHDPILQDNFYLERLENGLTIAVYHKPGYQMRTARIAAHYGSIDSQFVDPQTGQTVRVPDGIAHFLEHKLFEDETGNVSDRFAELGAESNAYTTYTHTVYYFNTTENFDDCLELLLNFVQKPWFTDESVAKEQGIIEQEIRMYLDDPGWRSSANMIEALYVNHPVRIDIAGTVESIHQITKETLYLCHRMFYHPSNMVLFVAGDVDPARVIETVAQNYSQRNYPRQAEIQRVMPEEPKAVLERKRTQKLVVNQPILRLGFKDESLGLLGRDLLELDLLTAVVMDAVCGKGSSLYTELYEAGLIDHRFGFEFTADETFGYSFFAGPTRNPDELESRLLKGLQAAQARGIDPGDFERARKKALGRIIHTMNDVDSIAYLFQDGFFKGIDLFDLIPVSQALNLEKANRRLRDHFSVSQAAVSVIEPADQA